MQTFALIILAYGKAIVNVKFNLIMDIIQKAHSIGLHVLSVRSDMGSSNRAMWKTFGISCTKDGKVTASWQHPLEPTRKLFFLVDVPHIIKNMRSVLVKNNIIYTGKSVSVEPIKN